MFRTTTSGLETTLPLAHTPPSLPAQICQVFTSSDVFVTSGANLGDGLAAMEEVCLGDMYELAQGSAPQTLTLERGSNSQIVAKGSEVGTPGDAVILAARYTMMAPDGDRVELLALRVGADGGYWLLPLSPIGENIEYMLVKTEDSPPEERLMDLLCISFGRGTMITLDDGSQRAIEALVPGDRVLTRDHGPQELRWVGQVTLRAVGAYAPVVIPAGTMGNTGDLVVSQHHRMFLYQRRRSGDMPKSEILVQAKHLADGGRIYLREGGFVDYFSLVFDDHEIIYAEGIPAESLMVSDATVSRLPPELAAEVAKRFPGLSQIQHFGVEAGPKLLATLGLDPAKRGRGAR